MTRHAASPVERFRTLERELWTGYGLMPSERYLSLATISGKVRLFEFGEGEPLLFVHGGGSFGSTFVPLLPHLTGYRLVVLDRPGHGLSCAFDYRSVNLRSHATSVLTGVMDALEIDQVPLVANSHGGLWSFWLAIDHPARVSAVVQLGCPGHLLETAFQSLAGRLFMQPAVLAFLLYLERIYITRFRGWSIPYRAMWTRFGHGPEVLERLPDAFFLLNDAHAFLPSFRATIGSFGRKLYTLLGPGEGIALSEPDLLKIAAPTFFYWGAQDTTGHPNVGHQAVALMPNASITVVPGGHMPWLDDPEGCARAVRAYLQSVPKREQLGGRACLG